MTQLKRGHVFLVALVAASLLAGCGSSHRYRVDVIFDSAKGVVAGQQVKIAGARVGSISRVSLTPGYKARISLDVDARFGPFHDDATCSLRPQALIGERFVECDPGSVSSPILRGPVPVSHTTLPVSLSDLFKVFDVPSSQRLTILLSSLGIGVSGRAQDLNGILRRANPTLGQVRDLLATLYRQRNTLRGAVSASDRVLAALAAHRGGMAQLLRSSAGVATRLARQEAAITTGEHDLPAVLTQTRSTLAKLDAAAGQLTPVLRDTRAAAAPLRAALAQLPSFAAAARPALAHVGAAARRGSAGVHSLTATTALLARFAKKALPVGKTLSQVLVSLRDTKTLDGLLDFTYNTGAVLALHDGISHIGSSKLGPSICLEDVQVGCGPTGATPATTASTATTATTTAAAGRAGGAPSTHDLTAMLEYLLR